MSVSCSTETLTIMTPFQTGHYSVLNRSSHQRSSYSLDSFLVGNSSAMFAIQYQALVNPIPAVKPQTRVHQDTCINKNHSVVMPMMFTVIDDMSSSNCRIHQKTVAAGSNRTIRIIAWIHNSFSKS